VGSRLSRTLLSAVRNTQDLTLYAKITTEFMCTNGVNPEEFQSAFQFLDLLEQLNILYFNGYTANCASNMPFVMDYLKVQGQHLVPGAAGQLQK
jgi:hypothetical protein